MCKKGRLCRSAWTPTSSSTISDKATYEDANQPAVGVQRVLVNGGFAVRDGALILDAPQQASEKARRYTHEKSYRKDR